MNNYKVALVLGSGSSRGWAHIGVIEALQEAGIPIHFVAGCSVGAFVGAVFASGGLDHLKEYVINMDGESMFSFSDLTLLRSGLIDGDRKLREIFCMHSDKKDFSELEIPLKVVATDMHSGDQVVFASGDLLKALRASMSFPGLFAPVKHKGKWLIDGGGAFFLQKMLGTGRAYDILLSEKNISANEALTLGIVDKVVPLDKLEEAALNVAHRFGKKSARSLTGVKKLLNYSKKDLNDYLEFEKEELMKILSSLSNLFY